MNNVYSNSFPYQRESEHINSLKFTFQIVYV